MIRQSHLILWAEAGVALALVSSPISAGADNAPPAAPAWNVPPRAARERNPVPNTPNIIAQAKPLYQKECLPCHGPQGKGNGPKAADLQVHPGDLSSQETLGQTDGELYWKIRRGRTPMPSYRTFSSRDCWALIHYIRTLEQAEPSSPPSVTEAPPPPIEEPQTSEAKPEPESAPVTESPADPAVELEPEDANPGPIDPSLYVRREEYDRMKTEQERLKQEVEALKAMLQNGAEEPGKSPLAAEVNDLAESVDYLDETVENREIEARLSASGTTRPLLSGFASAGFTGREQGDSSFSAGIAPLVLWQLNDKLLVEGEIEARLAGNETDLELVRSQLYYVLNDWTTLGAGKFLSPMNFLEDRLHQVNKLPDAPIAIATLLPKSNVGLQLRGAVPFRKYKFDYSFYLANAPGVEAREPARLGTLDFDNFDNVGGDPAVGGRIGFFPLPDLQFGYGFQVARVEADGEGTEALLHSLDFNYVRDLEAIKGTINLLGQWAWSDVGTLPYDPEGAFGFGPVQLGNRRNGGYLQAAYRPERVANQIVSRIESILRYDRLNQRGTPAGFDQERWTIGLNYWLLPSAVFKAAYQFDDRSDNQDSDAVMLQFKIGF